MEKQNVLVGKYTLESLTTGMYADPKIIYREYIQNSVDALEEAVNRGIIAPQSMRIDIVVDEENSTISIKDNGTGVPASKTISTLMNIGNSSKRQSSNRGFRGIGRLGGMSYCDTLIFSTSAENEITKTTITFDCKKLRELLRPGTYDDMALEDVMNVISSVKREPEKIERHYFSVELHNVSGLSDLLDVEAIRKYICQVAPVAYAPRGFIYSKQLKDYMVSRKYSIEEFPIFVGESTDELQPVYKPNKSHFHADRKKRIDDDIFEMKYFDVYVGDKLYAAGWYGDCNWYGMLSDNEMAGLRARKGNILIGDNKTLNGIFNEERFNGWTQGEIFILTDELIPNARRDDFEQNEAYYSFINALKESIGMEIPRRIREASNQRNDNVAKVIKQATKTEQEAKKTLDEGFNSSIDKERLASGLKQTLIDLEGTRPKEEERKSNIEKLKASITKTIKTVEDSNNYKLNSVNLDKKSKKLLRQISEILSKKLSKFLVDEIIEEIKNTLERN